MKNKTVTLDRELACPFCGSKELRQVTDDGIHFTQCKSCEATGPTGFKYGEDGAIDWNTRAALAEPVPPAGTLAGCVGGTYPYDLTDTKPVQPAGGGLTASMREDLQVLRDMKADADSLGETLDGESLAELAALEAADPVPPAGGDSSQTKIKPVFMLRAERLWGKDGEYAVTTEDHEWVNGCRKVGGDFPVYSGEAVTRLQAEVEQWKESRNDLIEGNDKLHLQIAELQAEVESLQLEFMTKDAEIKLGDEYAAYMDKRCAAAEAEVERLKDRLADANAIANLATTNLQEFKEDHQSVLTKAREYIQSLRGVAYTKGGITLDASIDAFLAHQPAPAAKDENYP